MEVNEMFLSYPAIYFIGSEILFYSYFISISLLPGYSFHCLPDLFHSFPALFHSYPAVYFIHSQLYLIPISF